MACNLSQTIFFNFQNLIFLIFFKNWIFSLFIFFFESQTCTITITLQLLYSDYYHPVFIYFMVFIDFVSNVNFLYKFNGVEVKL